ncbi:MAG: respiratory chain complex I subunit 1 family protein [Desulfurella sp.]|uniref:Formate hydrogenlyase subunit 4 n=1 Tax=Desulfurella multipotens TaxID=79269 RepID=A0A1G6QLF2_9BACT|nr:MULTISPECIES: NADH-quinone oxidoreductase subunit H [Desulfurella]PMP88775.1 MAG: formate hydrogenlyase subunit 4 [Desulfurella sp.]SDC92854.1 Formate hydrogenlyase subunit 4 [Desulfurella multipotens]HEX12994.1 formate hydrogenlyase subunit 4 [Desulfurella acetivorans]
MLFYLSIAQLLYVIILSPLAIGILNFFNERLSSRGGPSIFQEYYNLFKYFKKQSIYPESSSIFFAYVPYMSFAMYLFLTLVLPIITAFPLTFGPVVDFVGGGLVFGAASTLIKLSALDSKNNYSILGASRSSSIGIFTEPVILLIFIMLGVISGTNNPYVINNIMQTSTSWYYSLVHLFIALAFLFVLIIEIGQLPIESSSLNELGSIDTLLIHEYSGRELALLKWGSYIKQFILMNVFLNVYTWPFFVPMKLSLISIFFYMFINFFKIIILLIIFAFINSMVSKYRLFKIFDYIAIAFSFTLLAMLVFYITTSGG